jgi:hypothetical protein
VLAGKGVWMDADINKYDLTHRVSRHPTMSDSEWDAIYRECWRLYFNEEHLETVLRRGAARGLNLRTLLHAFTGFRGAVEIENLHPLEGGLLRRKVRHQRRPGFRMLNPLIFYPWRTFDWFRQVGRAIALYLRFRRVWKRVVSDPNRHLYTDFSLQPVTEEEETELMATYEAAIPNTHGAPVKRHQPPQVVPSEAAE